MSPADGAACAPGRYPAELVAEATLRDGGVVYVRPVRPDDGPALAKLHGRLSREAVYFRYFSPRRELPRSQLEQFTHVDYRDRMGFVVEHAGELIAHACYVRDAQSDEAEVAFEVQEDHWGRGLATLLLRKLAEVARRNGIGHFTAHVLPENRRMLEVFRDAGLPEKARFASGLVRVVLDLGGARAETSAKAGGLPGPPDSPGPDVFARLAESAAHPEDESAARDVCDARRIRIGARMMPGRGSDASHRRFGSRAAAAVHRNRAVRVRDGTSEGEMTTRERSEPRPGPHPGAEGRRGSKKRRTRLRPAPKLRFGRFLRLIVSETPFVRMLLLLIVLWLLFSAGLYLTESGTEGTTISSYGRALYWGVAAFSTAGIADTPQASASQLVGGIWIVVGPLVFFGTIVATVTAYFMRPLQRPAKRIIDTIEYNLEHLEDLSVDELDLLRETTDTLIDHVERLKRRQPAGKVSPG